MYVGCRKKQYSSVQFYRSTYILNTYETFSAARHMWGFFHLIHGKEQKNGSICIQLELFIFFLSHVWVTDVSYGFIGAS